MKRDRILPEHGHHTREVIEQQRRAEQELIARLGNLLPVDRAAIRVERMRPNPAGDRHVKAVVDMDRLRQSSQTDHERDPENDPQAPLAPRLLDFRHGHSDSSSLLPSRIKIDRQLSAFSDRDATDSSGSISSGVSRSDPTRFAPGLGGDLEITVPQPPHDRVPRLPEGIRSGRSGHRAAQGVVVDEPLQLAGKNLGGRVGGEQETGPAVPDDIDHTPRSQGHHRQSRGQGFEHHVAEGLRDARKGEEVGRGIVIGQLVAAPVADEAGVRTHSLLDRLSGRPVTHEEEPRAGSFGRQGRERLRQVIDVFLRRQPADVPDHDLIGPEPQGRSNRATAGSIGAEDMAVHPARPEHQPLEPAAMQVVDRPPRGDIGFPRPIVEPPEVSPDRPPCPTNPVVPAVLVEIGVKARYQRRTPPTRVPQDAQPQRGLGRDVDQVGTKGVDRLMNRAERRQGNSELPVERRGPRTDPVRRLVLNLPALAIIGHHELNHVPRRVQMLDKLAEGPRDPVDLGKIGLCHQCQTHGGGPLAQHDRHVRRSALRSRRSPYDYRKHVPAKSNEG